MHVAGFIEISQYRDMSKQELPILQTTSCCTSLQTAPLDENQATELATVFKALGDPVRLRLLSLIAAAEADKGVCVCELTPAFELSQPTISHHLKLLRQAGLVGSERRGTWVYYWLLPKATDRLAALLSRPVHEWQAEPESEAVSR
jgi:DNA-binding transcriptional ArsR family regulator